MGKRYLIDSNVIIDFIGKLLPAYSQTQISDIIDKNFNISIITKIEIIGHPSANIALSNFIGSANIILLNEDIIEQTIQLRKNHKIKIPDAIVGATAMVNNLTLVTRNMQDFKRIQGLKSEDPWLWK